jgi:hypothetical protein
MFSRRCAAARALLLPLLVTATSLGALSERAEDGNRDGTVDTWIQEENGRIVSLSRDRNFDGSIDSRKVYHPSGAPQLEELDFNFDGIMDDFYYYEEGVLIRQEIDTNFDGSVDVWVELVDGLYVASYEQDTDFDGTPDRRREFGRLPGVARSPN